MQRLRIDLVTPELGHGGVEHQLSILARGLRSRGMDVRVLALLHGGAHEDALREAGIPVVKLGFTTRAEAGWRCLSTNALAFVRLVGLLRRSRPDILHAHLFRAYAVCLPAAKLAGVPRILAGLHNMGRHLTGRHLLILDRAATRLADAVTVVSRAVAEYASDRLRVPAPKIAVIHNGVPDQAFHPARPSQLDTPNPLVVCVARLAPVKGHRHLLDALALLRDRGNKTTTVLLGDGPERDRLQAHADRLDLDVRFLGSRSDVTSWLARADLAVLPSLTEAFGLAAAEAMATRTPLITTNVDGLPEIVRDHGILVPPADPQALADAIERLLADRPHAERLADAAQTWAREHLRADTMIDKYLELYRTPAR
ncbi:glycosyltransferase [Streptosporangium sp. KLBMP 9127]|nr:glycosyltransferase [Streptosporangium sp. KLBMP 9127]